ncbi:cell wall protein [Nocardiopsis sp. ATB16-24]|uniref:cell wall protein n=1 Tax=Nocardiopsis sp. ATB16-24 TaxID=3019555 RepID=UPI0025527157|nr:cell wall protein [Nocardiopsis sp. ATB16-24]
MRIDLKNTRIAARRVLQGGAAFAALGALSIATALPAAADAQVVGWAYAEVPGGFAVAETYITPQGESSSDSNGGSFSIDKYLSVDVSTTASVGAGGSTATTTVNSARLVLTEADVEEIIEEVELQSEEGDEAETEADESDETEETDEAQGEEGDEAGETDEADQPAEDPAPAEGENGGDTGEGDADTGDADGGEGGAVEEETSPAPAEDSVSVTLDEENSETVSGSDKIVLDVTISGASVTTTQSWSGEPSNTYKAGDIHYAVNDLGAKVDLDYEDDGYDFEDAGYLWEDAYTALLMDITVPEQFSGGYVLGVSYAGIGVESTDDGGDDGGKGDDDKGDDKDDKGGDEGEDKNPPKRDTEKLPQPEPKETESLARTGSPLAGLIAAGAAIATGGGVAAYFARRKKSAVESTTENSES